MKTVEEWADHDLNAGCYGYLEMNPEGAQKFIEAIQREAYNQAIEDAALEIIHWNDYGAKSSADQLRQLKKPDLQYTKG